MWMLIGIVYLAIGGTLCYLFKVNAEDHFEDCCGDDYGTLLAVITGAAWPIVSPFTFAILLAKKKGVN